MISFPVKLTEDKDSGGFVVTFPDIPEAITQGDTVEEALKNAAEALELSMDFYFEKHRKVPHPSPIKKGLYQVSLPPSIETKVLLLNTMVENKVRPSELARKMGATRQEVNRLTDLRHATKIDSISAALRAMGKQLDIRVVKSATRGRSQSKAELLIR